MSPLPHVVGEVAALKQMREKVVAPSGGRMLGALLKLRWLAGLIAVFCGLHAVAFVALGIVRGASGYRLIFAGPPWDPEHLPGVEIARSLDAFLIALVFIVFAIGIVELFVVRNDHPGLDMVRAWMRVRSLTE